MKKTLLASALAVALAGCCSRPVVTVTKTVEVKVPVAVSCLKQPIPVKPTLRFGRSAKPASPTDAVKLAGHDLESLEAYGRDWEAAAAGCVLLAP